MLTFVGCLSVAVRDLYGETSQVMGTRGSAGRSHINGTLAFSNCGEVTVEDAWLRCGSAVSTRGAACISVGSDVTEPGAAPGNVTTGAGSVRIRGCRLYVGEMQVGIQLVHQERAIVEDNEIFVDPAVPATTLGARLADPGYLAVARGYLISQATLLPALPKSGAITVTVGNQTLNFVAASGLGTTWQTYIKANAPTAFATQADALRWVKKQASTILTTPAARARLSGFAGVLRILDEHVPLASRGIVVGGQAIRDLQIVGNTISGLIMGICVGVSHRASTAEAQAEQRTPDHMQTIRIADNTISCSANDMTGPPASTGNPRPARFGVFVGNADSLQIEGNRLTLARAGLPAAPPADAIRVAGYLGIKAVIRHNHMTGFAMGIRVVPLTGNGPGVRSSGCRVHGHDPERPAVAGGRQRRRGGEREPAGRAILAGQSGAGSLHRRPSVPAGQQRIFLGQRVNRSGTSRRHPGGTGTLLRQPRGLP